MRGGVLFSALIMPNPLDPRAIKLVKLALEELTKRGAENDKCPRCGTSDWSVDPIAISVVPMTLDNANKAQLVGAYFPAHIPLLQIVCKNCGYTMFHNLSALGLAEFRS